MFSSTLDADRPTPDMSPVRPLPISRSTSSSWSWGSKEKKIKSLITHRRLSYNHETGTPTIDLSRSSAEHEDLGIYTTLTDSGRSFADDASSNVSNSGNNNLYGHVSPSRRCSTSPRSPRPVSSATLSMNNRQSYVHPMRQAPRPFTPIVNNPASRHEAINEDDDDNCYFPSHYVTSHDLSTYYLRTSHSSTPQPEAHAPSPLQQHDEQDSSEQEQDQPPSPSPELVTRPQSLVLPPQPQPQPQPSQNSISRESGHFVTAVVGAISSTSTRMSRGSLDLSKHRHHRRSSSYYRHSADGDCATRAAAVLAARQAFEDSEAAKDRKIENALRKARERQQQQQQQQQRRRSRKEDVYHRASSSVECCGGGGDDDDDGVSISSDNSRRGAGHEHVLGQRDATTYCCCGARRMLRRISFRHHQHQHQHQNQQQDSRRSSGSDSASCSGTGFGTGTSSPWTHTQSKRTTHNPRDSYFLFLTWMRTRMFKLGRRLNRNHSRKAQ